MPLLWLPLKDGGLIAQALVATSWKTGGCERWLPLKVVAGLSVAKRLKIVCHGHAEHSSRQVHELTADFTTALLERSASRSKSGSQSGDYCSAVARSPCLQSGSNE